MKQFAVDHPSPATERTERWADLEMMIQGLQELGWVLEKMSQVDEAGEPLRFFLRMHYEAPTSIGGII